MDDFSSEEPVLGEAWEHVSLESKNHTEAVSYAAILSTHQ
jgi:hypothetical protein